MADRRYSEAYQWYAERSPRAAEQFERAVAEVLERLEQGRMKHGYFRKPVRKASVKRYPFLVLYEALGDVVLVHNVFHTKRDPKSWRR